MTPTTFRKIAINILQFTTDRPAGAVGHGRTLAKHDVRAYTFHSDSSAVTRCPTLNRQRLRTLSWDSRTVKIVGRDEKEEVKRVYRRFEKYYNVKTVKFSFFKHPKVGLGYDRTKIQKNCVFQLRLWSRCCGRRPEFDRLQCCKAREIRVRP